MATMVFFENIIEKLAYTRVQAVGTTIKQVIKTLKM